MIEQHRRKTNQARVLRNSATPAERVLWVQLSARKVSGVRFNRQVCIGPFICDFAARTPKLVIEVDGGQHAINAEEDAARTRFIETQGYRVLRFWNNDVLERTEGVVIEIELALGALALPQPLPRAGGEF
jgi:very-short-patch-repair endonuclease